MSTGVSSVVTGANHAQCQEPAVTQQMKHQVSFGESLWQRFGTAYPAVSFPAPAHPWGPALDRREGPNERQFALCRHGLREHARRRCRSRRTPGSIRPRWCPRTRGLRSMFALVARHLSTHGSVSADIKHTILSRCREHLAVYQPRFMQE